MIKILINNFALFSIILSLNLFFLLFFKKISRIYKLFDYPDNDRKIHKKPISLMGGLIVFSSFTFTIFYIFTFMEFKDLEANLYIFSVKNFIIFVFVLFSIFILGILDDKFFLNPIKKFIILIFLISILCTNDHTTLVSEFKIPINDLNISFKQLSLIFSLSCYVFLIISLNMYDGINLQSFLFYFINFAFLLINNDHSSIIIFSILISLLVFGFLNYKNKVFLGDNGTFILAFVLGYFFVKTHNYTDNYNSIDIFNFLFLPVVDAVRVILERQFKNKKIFLPDKIHFHHILLKNYNYRNTVMISFLFVLFPHIFYFLKINSFITTIVLFFPYFYILRKK